MRRIRSINGSGRSASSSGFESTQDAVLHLAGSCRIRGGVPVRQVRRIPTTPCARSMPMWIAKPGRCLSGAGTGRMFRHRIAFSQPCPSKRCFCSQALHPETGRALAEGFLRGRPANEETFIRSDQCAFVHCLQRLPEAEERAAMQAYLKIVPMSGDAIFLGRN